MNIGNTSNHYEDGRGYQVVVEVYKHEIYLVSRECAAHLIDGRQVLGEWTESEVVPIAPTQVDELITLITQAKEAISDRH